MKQPAAARLPVATLSILLVTAVLTGLQFAFPQILPALMRTPAAVTRNEWWRLVTPLFVHAVDTSSAVDRSSAHSWPGLVQLNNKARPQSCLTLSTDIRSVTAIDAVASSVASR